MVARPAACRLRTQSTGPYGAITVQPAGWSLTATGVVRGIPLLRPGTVSRTIGPIPRGERIRKGKRRLAILSPGLGTNLFDAMTAPMRVIYYEIRTICHR